MHFRPQDAGVPVAHSPMIAMELQEVGPVNPNPDANGPLLQNIKRSPLRVELTQPKQDIVTPEIRPNLKEVDPETKR
uniref:Uncharacterized protein n=1 Tax=Romanomermis culicivorax TaxID=13658 RepID=A0A915JZE9_ROMCU